MNHWTVLLIQTSSYCCDKACYIELGEPIGTENVDYCVLFLTMKKKKLEVRCCICICCSQNDTGVKMFCLRNTVFSFSCLFLVSLSHPSEEEETHLRELRSNVSQIQSRFKEIKIKRTLKSKYSGKEKIGGRWERNRMTEKKRKLRGEKGESFYNSYPDYSKNVHRDLKEAVAAEATEFTYITQG